MSLQDSSGVGRASTHYPLPGAAAAHGAPSFAAPAAAPALYNGTDYAPLHSPSGHRHHNAPPPALYGSPPAATNNYNGGASGHGGYGGGAPFRPSHGGEYGNGSARVSSGHSDPLPYSGGAGGSAGGNSLYPPITGASTQPSFGHGHSGSGHWQQHSNAHSAQLPQQQGHTVPLASPLRHSHVSSYPTPAQPGHPYAPSNRYSGNGVQQHPSAYPAMHAPNAAQPPGHFVDASTDGRVSTGGGHERPYATAPLPYPGAAGGVAANPYMAAGGGAQTSGSAPDRYPSLALNHPGSNNHSNVNGDVYEPPDGVAPSAPDLPSPQGSTKYPSALPRV